VTTAPAPINAYFPILFPHTMVALAPIDAPFLIDFLGQPFVYFSSIL
jgi:hypothetical protein